MVTRNLTDAFVLMRNNALQNRHIFYEQTTDDREALVDRGSDGALSASFSQMNKLPPLWVDSVEEVQYDLTKIKQKMKDLMALHNKHLHRPTLDDSTAEEYEIEILTMDITQMMQRCQRTVQQINGSRRVHSGAKEDQLAANIVSSLARSVQDLSLNFRRSQSKYLNQLKSREDRNKQFFDIDLDEGSDMFDDDRIERGFSLEQVQMVKESSILVGQREKEIAQIVRSIHDLNEIFKDLAAMIVDQGTILDRIDYNIEQTSTSVDRGLKHLQKAEKYQRKNRKMLVISVLFVLVILLIILLIIVKS